MGQMIIAHFTVFQSLIRIGKVDPDPEKPKRHSKNEESSCLMSFFGELTASTRAEVFFKGYKKW
jgi:hypothetical protein